MDNNEERDWVGWPLLGIVAITCFSCGFVVGVFGWFWFLLY